MAVIEIAKIQVRTGQENQTGVPALDGGEFAWAADTEKLYIGLRRVDGGSRDDNVEILTENHLKNFFSPGITDYDYTYRKGSTSTVNNAGGITAEDATDDEVIRTLQERLDETVSSHAFGVYGNGVDWDLRKLQLAIDRLFLNTGGYDPHPAKKLYFPAGTYNITGTVYIPANTHLIGDGQGKTIFVYSGDADAVFKTMDLKSVEGSVNPLHFDSSGGNGADFESTTSARLIHLEDFSIICDPVNTTITQDLSLISLDCADDSVIRNVEFAGNSTYDSLDLTTSTYNALAIRGKTSDGTNHNSIVDNCVFRNVHSAIVSDHDIVATKITNSKFYELDRGIKFNDPVNIDADVGPFNIKITDNHFDLIRKQAVYVGPTNASTGSYVISQRNTYARVGFNDQPDGDVALTATSVISFLAENCSSIDDIFLRQLTQDNFSNNIESTTTYYPSMVEGRTTLDASHVTVVEIPPDTPTTVLRIPITGNPQHLNIKYNVYKENVGTFSSPLAVDAVAATTVTMVGIAGVGIGMECSGTIILTTTTVVDIDFVTNEITLDNPVTGPAGTEIFFNVNLDRMGIIDLYLQGQDNPQYIINDNYNYISGGSYDYDGGVTFSIEVNAEYKYYNVNALLNGTITVPVTLAYQTKLMI